MFLLALGNSNHLMKNTFSVGCDQCIAVAQLSHPPRILILGDSTNQPSWRDARLLYVYSLRLTNISRTSPFNSTVVPCMS